VWRAAGREVDRSADERGPAPTAGFGVPTVRCASIEAMLEERRIRTRTPEWRTIYDRIQVAMELTSRLNVLPFSDIEARNALLSELLGKPLPRKPSSTRRSTAPTASGLSSASGLPWDRPVHSSTSGTSLLAIER
jgi:hypothetical protein